MREAGLFFGVLSNSAKQPSNKHLFVCIPYSFLFHRSKVNAGPFNAGPY